MSASWLVLSGLVGTVGRAVKFWLHYTLVAVAWLGVVPLTACRIYRTLFTGSVSTTDTCSCGDCVLASSGCMSRVSSRINDNDMLLLAASFRISTAFE